MPLHRGFTYLEVIAALFVIGSILVVFFATFKTLPVNRYAKDQDIALKIANSEIEALRGAGYSAIATTTASFTDPTMNELPNGSGSVTGSDFNSGTREVQVTVDWTEPDTGNQSISLATLVTSVGALP